MLNIARRLTIGLFVAGIVAPLANADVNVYSSRKEALIKPVLDKFTERTGIKVNLVTGKDDALISRLSMEGARTPADLLFTADAGRLVRASKANLLQPIEDESILNKIPENLQDPKGQWIALTQRARPIFYVKGKVDPKDLTEYQSLTDAKFKGRVCIRSSSNIYNQSLIASMIEHQGAEKTEEFAEGLVENFARPPVGGDTDQLKAAAAGVCDVAVANTYYFGRLGNSDKPADKKVYNALAIAWPNQDGQGTHVNVSGVGLVKASKNTEEAKQLVQFLLQKDSQKWYAEVNNEYPVVEGVEASATLESWGTFKSDAIDLVKLGENNQEAVKLMDRAGWR